MLRETQAINNIFSFFYYAYCYIMSTNKAPSKFLYHEDL